MITKDPKEGEIWTYKTSSRKTEQEHTSVIVSIPALRSIPYRISVPVIRWMKENIEYAWMVLLQPTRTNGLKIITAADAKRCCSQRVQAFISKIGTITGEQLQEIREAIALCIGLSNDGPIHI